MNLARLNSVLVVFPLALCICGPASAAKSCSDLLPEQRDGVSHGPVTPEILSRLRDPGPIYHWETSRPILALSPDKRSVAFEIHRGDPSDNSYCVGIAVQPLQKNAKPHLIDVGHELILDRRPSKGWAAFESGVPLPVTPRWAPNGTWLAFLKRVDGSTQVWRAEVSGKDAGQLTHSEVDVDDFRLTPDGSTVVYSARPNLVQNEKAIDFEGLRGWHYDARALPLRSARPKTPNAGTHYVSVDLHTGVERSASAFEASLFDRPAGIPKEASAFSIGPNEQLAWIQPTDSPVYPTNYDLVVEARTGQRLICKAAICRPYGMTQLWWSYDGKILRFTRREGWANSLTAIYQWVPGEATPKRVYVTSDALIECHPLYDDLLCFREGSNEPRHIVLLDLDHNREQRKFDSNPEFSNSTLGRVERQQWRNESRVKFFGDLVYPTSFSAGQRFPLVVVQYRTRGFLRGGVGDEMPIQAFANRGYFVLVVDIGDEASVVGPQMSAAAQQVAFYRELIGVRSIFSGIDVITKSLVDRGLVDAGRVGISGLSAGSRTVQYAAVNSSLFSAGSVGGCCEERGQDAFLGSAIAENYRKNGWPMLIDQAPTFWSQISLKDEPKRVAFPILIQAADNEYLGALGSMTAMSQSAIPVDMFVFPNEYHIKWQPAHRLAIYKRNIAWFEFWLNGRLSFELTQREEIARWSEMRQNWRR